MLLLEMQREDNPSGEDKRRPSYGHNDDEFVDISSLVQQRIFGSRAGRHHGQLSAPLHQQSNAVLYQHPIGGSSYAAASSQYGALQLPGSNAGTGTVAPNEPDWFTKWFNNTATGPSTSLLPGKRIFRFYCSELVFYKFSRFLKW